MAEIIINKERYECPPAVAAYIKQLERNNLNLQEEFYKQGTKIDELKAENARLEEGFQKATGVIAATDCVRCDKYALENKALKLLLEWAEECDFGYDNFHEEYERYKDEIEGMSYIDGMIHIAKRVIQRQNGGVDE